MDASVVVLWAIATDDGLDIATAHAAGKNGTLERCTTRQLAARTVVASSYAAVVAVVEDDRAATEALGAGVDEIVRRTEVTTEALERATHRASARAAGRLRVVKPPVDQASSFALLLDWIAIELVASLSGAMLESEILDEQVRRLAEQQRAAATRPASSTELLEMLATVKESQRHSREILQAVRSLSGSDAISTSVPDVLRGLERVLRSRCVPLVDLRVDVEGTCATSVPVPTLVASLVALVASALARAARPSSDPRRELVLRAFMAEGSVIVEVEDNGDEDAGGGSRLASDAMATVRASLREHGVEVLLESAPARTTARLVLPEAEDAVPRMSSDWDVIVPRNRAN